MQPYELPLCFNILSITSILFTWGSPVLGGYLSQSTSTFRTELLVVNIIQAFSVFFALFIFPETSVKPSTSSSDVSRSTLRSYASSLHPLPYTTSFTRAALQPIRALATPSAVLTLALAGPLTASAFGLSNSLSLLFTSNPVYLFPAHLGFLFSLPVALALLCCIVITVLTLLSHARLSSYRLVVPGTVIGLVGLIAFGLYAPMHFPAQDQSQPPVSSAVFARDSGVAVLSLPVVSLLLGLLVAGAAIFGAALQLHGSISLRYGGMESMMGDNGDVNIERACRVWINILSGIFIIAIPAFASEQRTGTVIWLQDAAIAIAVFQILACGVVGAVTFVKGEKFKILDGKVLGFDNETDGARAKGFLSA